MEQQLSQFQSKVYDETSLSSLTLSLDDSVTVLCSNHFNKTRANTGKGLTGADLVSRLKMLKVRFRCLCSLLIIKSEDHF